MRKAIVVDKFMQNTRQWLKIRSVKGIEEKCEATPIMERRHTFDSDSFPLHSRVKAQSRGVAVQRGCSFEEPRPNTSMEKRRFTLWTGAEQI